MIDEAQLHSNTVWNKSILYLSLVSYFLLMTAINYMTCLISAMSLVSYFLLMLATGKNWWWHNTDAYLLSVSCATCIQNICRRAGIKHSVYQPALYLTVETNTACYIISPSMILPTMTQVDVVILEVGLGGKFDATNVVCTVSIRF